MKIVERDQKIEEQEAKQVEFLREKKRLHDESMQAFRESSAYEHVLRYFDDYTKDLEDEIDEMQLRDMKDVFMLPAKEQRVKMAKMSKRHAIITGVLSIIKQVKNKL